MTGILPVIGTSTMLSLVTNGKLPFCPQELGIVPAQQSITNVNADVCASSNADVNAYVDTCVDAYGNVVRAKRSRQKIGGRIEAHLGSYSLFAQATLIIVLRANHSFKRHILNAAVRYGES